MAESAHCFAICKKLARTVRWVLEVILPVLDEAEALPGVLAAFPAGFEPLVVDNGSTDGSARVACELGARVVSEPRRGFGAACWAGLSAARSELVCFMDCDGSLDPAELPAVVGPVSSGKLDLCLGARHAEPGAWPAHARVANRMLAWQLRRRAGVGLTDLGPMRCAGREPLLALHLRDRAFGWPLEMVLAAAAAGWRVGETPVGYGPRAGGESKVSGSISGSLRAVRDMTGVLRSLA
jgi:glycosyltransferase involved in cell wall biosynthesis